MQFVEHDAPQRAEQNGASALASSSASCSGVVSRMSGGSRRWRWRLEAGVSPVRVSSRTAGPSRAPGSPDCARCRPRAPSAARCRACAGPASAPRASGRFQVARPPSRRSTRPASAGNRRASCRRRSARSAAWSALPSPSPASRAGARAAASRGWRTSARTGRAAARGVEKIACGFHGSVRCHHDQPGNGRTFFPASGAVIEADWFSGPSPLSPRERPGHERSEGFHSAERRRHQSSRGEGKLATWSENPLGSIEHRRETVEIDEDVGGKHEMIVASSLLAARKAQTRLRPAGRRGPSRAPARSSRLTNRRQRSSR